MSEGARIVSADETDLPRIAALAAVVWRAHYPGIIGVAQIEYMLARMYDLEVLRAELRHGISYELLRVQDALIAFASYGRIAPEEAKLYKLYVHPEHQRYGFGSQLLRHVAEAAKALGCNSLCLTVNKQNAKAIAAYQKNGFTVCDAVLVEIGGGFVMDDYVMAKAL